MLGNDLISSIFFIFTGASILATVALYTRQAILVAYILLGMIIGPNGIGLITDSVLINDISNIGIVFLLFLLGLNLHPQSLLRTLEKTAFITIVSSFLFFIIALVIALLFNFSTFEAVIIGCCAMFSSTILGLKLLPTMVLHHKNMGQIVISILLLQDLIAIVLILIFDISGTQTSISIALLKTLLELPGLIAVAFIVEKYIINKLFSKFDQTKEYIFLLAIGWCLGITELAHILGLSHEIGAFIAGITIASSPIALYISECLKPLRDFFLVMFFFALGAQFNFSLLAEIILPAIALVIILMLAKPLIYNKLLCTIDDPVFKEGADKKDFAKEIGVRLGQFSEFSLLLVFVANISFNLPEKVISLVLAMTIISFIISSYWIIMNYPTPLAVDEKLRKE